MHHQVRLELASGFEKFLGRARHLDDSPDGDGIPVSFVGIIEFRDGKIARMTEYFANPFEAPAWRADLVERMEPASLSRG
jgi:ketosteroid isomerase-like protein